MCSENIKCMLSVAVHNAAHEATLFIFKIFITLPARFHRRGLEIVREKKIGGESLALLRTISKGRGLGFPHGERSDVYTRGLISLKEDYRYRYRLLELVALIVLIDLLGEPSCVITVLIVSNS